MRLRLAVLALSTCALTACIVDGTAGALDEAPSPGDTAEAGDGGPPGTVDDGPDGSQGPGGSDGPPGDEDAGSPDGGEPMEVGDGGPPPTDGGDGGGADVRPSAGCTAASPLPEGEGTLTVNGVSRKYTVRLPAGYSQARAWPLVLALHPNGSNTSYWDGTSGDRNIRGVLREHAVLVLPEARTGDWRIEKEVDLTYFDQLLTRLKAQLCIDTRRIFAMGFSGGGSFSGMLGCRRTDIRAFAAGGSVIYFEPEACVGTPAAWITIGTQELAGREPFREYWRNRNQCASTSSPTAPAPCVAYACPHPDRPVHYCQHPGGHVWPSFGTAAAWDFFEKF